MPIYRVTNWKENYENSRTIHLKRMEWVPLPNRMDGDGYTELLDHPNGVAHFGCWVAIVEIASKCSPRGTLQREGSQPHTPATLARVSRIPVSVMAEALPRLMAIGWIEDTLASDKSSVTNIQHHEATLMQPVALSEPQMDLSNPQDPYGMEGNGMERKRVEIPAKDKMSEGIDLLRRTYRCRNRPTTDNDWHYGLQKLLSTDITSEELINEIVPWVDAELAKMSMPRKFYSPQRLFELDLKPWRVEAAPAPQQGVVAHGPRIPEPVFDLLDLQKRNPELWGKPGEPIPQHDETNL